jgi:hypothetical protein
MDIYKPKKQRGFWLFDSRKYGYNYNITPYPEIISDLKILLTLLFESKMLIPKSIGGEGQYIDLRYDDIDQLIELIEESGYLQNSYEFDIIGETIIYSKKGEETYSGIFTIIGFRTFHQNFAVSTKSDIWLPMAFDEDSFSYIWNLELHYLNYNRLPFTLKKLNNILGWENNNLIVRENRERGCLQDGYDIYIAPEVIKREWKENPNSNFNIENYLLKIK